MGSFLRVPVGVGKGLVLTRIPLFRGEWRLAPQAKVSSNHQGVTRIEGRVLVNPVIYNSLPAAARPQAAIDLRGLLAGRIIREAQPSRGCESLWISG